MSAERIRQAATVLREHAEAATPGGPRWQTEPDEMHGPSHSVILPADSDSAVAFAGADDAAYIALMGPDVGLAVADWLDLVARLLSEGFSANGETQKALAVADRILGGA